MTTGIGWRRFEVEYADTKGEIGDGDKGPDGCLTADPFVCDNRDEIADGEGRGPVVQPTRAKAGEPGIKPTKGEG